MSLVIADPWCVGYWKPEDGPAKRLCRVLCWMRTPEGPVMDDEAGELVDNAFARPVEGLVIRVDLQKMELQTTRDWLSPSKAHNREVLLRELQPELARRALLPQYADAQREQARKTVAEFAQKWMREQGSAKAPAVKVRFADEGAGGI